MRSARVTRHSWLALLGLLMARSVSAQAPADRAPVKLAVEPARLEVAAGDDLTVQVELRDAQGRAVAAPRRLVARTVAHGAGVDYAADHVFEADDTIRALRLSPTEEGLIEIQARSHELREGGAFVQVVPAPKPPPDPSAPAPSAPVRVPQASRSSSAARPTKGAGPTKRPENERLAQAHRELIARLGELPHSGLTEMGEASEPPAGPSAPDPDSNETQAPDDMEASTSAEAPNAQPDEGSEGGGEGPVVEPGQALPTLILRASPSRGLLANGEDTSTIYAFLRGGSAGPDGVRINLLPDSGALSPTPLAIAAGQHAGTANLTASRPGSIRLEFVSAQPEALVEGERTLKVDFQPAILGLALHMPPSAVLGDRVPVVVRLVGSDSGGVATDRPRTVSFARESGYGQLLEDEVQIPAGAFQAQTAFDADWWNPGAVEISAASNGLLTQRARIQVRWPWALMAVILAASMIGGFMAWTHGAGRRQHLIRRLSSGIVAGLVLYSLLRFVTPQNWINNPFGAFLIAVLGGWLGTKAFDIAVRALFGRQPAGHS